MKPFDILILSHLGICFASKMPVFVADFLAIPEESGNWNETIAADYLRELLEKHGSEVQQEIDRITEEDRTAYRESLGRRSIQNEKLWHVGDATLTRLDKSVFGSAFSKLKESLASWASLDKVNLQEYGFYFFSVSDTDIFEGLEEDL